LSVLQVEGIGLDVIQAPKPEPCIMRYELTDVEWAAIRLLLLSGGSSNIRWLKPLIDRDLAGDLREAEIIELNENFQEIVSKGLAVECARRFYTAGEGDFRAVTYNRLCLLLDPNGNGAELKPLQPLSPALADIQIERGVLLPSATSLRGLVGEKMRWKVRLSKAPTQTLDYFFLKSSFDPKDMDARHNLESRVQTPRGTRFASAIEVELTVREDGTAEPTFVYGTGSQGSTVAVDGKPFWMDMTYATDDAGVETYLGFDFGTSTSSLCYVDGNDIRVYADRATDQAWLGLNALIDVLPYPIAHPLARYLSESSTELMEKWGREAFEGMLLFIAYVGYAEHCAVGGGPQNVFKTMRKRSAGPLWAMFKKCAHSTGKKWQIVPQLAEIAFGSEAEEIDKSVSLVASAKHGKRAEGLDYLRTLQRLGNVIARGFDGKVFGYFEDGKRKRFSTTAFEGVFRNAKGPAAPFIDIFEYESAENFAPEFVFVFDVATGQGLSLFPLVTRGLDRQKSHFDSDFFVFDIVRRDEAEIVMRAVQERDEVVLEADGDIPELFECLKSYFERDQPSGVTTGVTLKSRRSD
jgi:hypothetical protein